MKIRIALVFTLLMGLVAFCRERVFHASANSVAAGAELWVDSGTSDADFAADLGSLHSKGDEIEAHYRRTLTGGTLAYVRRRHPALKIPEGTQELTDGRVVCGREQLIAFVTRERLLSPQRRLLFAQNFEPRKARDEASRTMHPRGYGNDDAASLVCWAVARKCEGKDLTWPPPDPPAGTGKDEYYRGFIPKNGCTF